MLAPGGGVNGDADSVVEPLDVRGSRSLRRGLGRYYVDSDTSSERPPTPAAPVDVLMGIWSSAFREPTDPLQTYPSDLHTIEGSFDPKDRIRLR